MLAFSPRVPSAFSGVDALQPRPSHRQSVEEQYFCTLAEQHERAAALARQRLQEIRQRQQQSDLEAKLRLQQQLAASLRTRTPTGSSYQPRALPEALFGFNAEGGDVFSGYSELMPRRSQAVMAEHQKRAQEQSILRAALDQQRRAKAECVAELERKRAEQAKAERERIIRAQRERAQMAERERARQHLAARAAEEQKVKAFFEALVNAINAEKEEGAELERKNAIRRRSVPIPAPVETPASARAPISTPKVSTPVPRAGSPSPSVASHTSEASLHSISDLQDKYDSLRSSFELPTTLSFAPSTNLPASAPALLFNSTNAPVHAYEHALTGLLVELDAVESFGDEHVRDVRRNLVKRVEGELEALEEKKREAWRRQSEPVVVESVPVAVKPTPAPVESAPALTEAVNTFDAVEPVSVPASVPALPTTVGSVNPFTDTIESPESPMVEQPEAVAVEQLESPIVDKPENLALESPEPTVTSQSPSFTAQSQPEPEPTIVESNEIATETEMHTSTELASSTPVSAFPSDLVAEPEDLAETEQLAHTTEPEVRSPTTHTESVVAESEFGSEPEVLAALQPESTEHESVKFVQVFPDSDSEVDTDVDDDLVSELADRSASGADEFEML